MADKRGYDLATEHITWDDDVDFNVDKDGFARAKKYKASVLKGHLKVGDQQYTEDNYVADDETLTLSVDKLDMALKDLANTVTAITTDLITLEIVLSAAQVATLGSEYTLMSAPPTDRAYQLIDMKWGVNPSSVLVVGGQSLEIYFDGMDRYLGLIRADSLQQGGRFIRGVQIQAEHELGISKGLMCKLSGDANPTSGSTLMYFWVVYKVIEAPALT